MKHNRKSCRAISRQVAEYYVENNSTVRKTAQKFGLSKSAVHQLLVEFQTNRSTKGTALAIKVEAQIQKNINERAKRGGMATKERFAKDSD